MMGEMTNPFLQEIVYDYSTANRKRVSSSLAAAIRLIEKDFPRVGHFVMEFIQNADDAEAHELSVEVRNESVTITNDGKPFQKENVDSICKVGQSSKKSDKYIGYLGVGFKSVFLISDKVEISSGDFHFKFDRHEAEKKWGSDIPWQIMPIETEPQSKIKNNRTEFTIWFKEGSKDMKERILYELSPGELRPRTLLFLHNIERINITSTLNSSIDRVLSRNVVESNSEWSKVEVQSTQFPSNPWSWLVFRSKVEVPQYIRNDPMTVEYDRRDIEAREIVVAFNINDEDGLEPEPQGTAHMGVFSYLPIKNVDTGLPFTIQADFLTGPGRSNIQNDSVWNIWLADEVFKLIEEKCIPSFLKDPKWAKNFSTLLIGTNFNDPIFGKKITSPLRKMLISKPLFLAEDGTRISLSKAIFISEEFRSKMDPDDLKIPYPDRKILSKGTEIPYQLILTGSIIIISSDYDFWNTIQMVASRKAGSQDVEWFKRLYSKDAPPKGNMKLYLRDDFTLGFDYDTYSISEEADPNHIMKGNIRISHSILNNSSWAKNIKSITKREVDDAVVKEKIPELMKLWPDMLEDDKLRKIRQLKEMVNEDPLSIGLLREFFTLPSKSGRWLNPNKLIFSEEYKPEHSLESLRNEGLFDSDCEFLSDRILEDNSDSAIESWKSFLKSVGVDSYLEKNGERVSQRIGVLGALKYERNNKRNATELTESDKKGYDIESVDSDGNKMLIEVKGSKNPSPDLPLTVHEHKILTENPAQYYVYIVADSWTKPIIRTIKGKELTSDILDYRINVPFNQWKEVASDPLSLI